MPKNIVLVSLILTASLIVSCSTELTPAGSNIRTLNPSDDSTLCEFLGTITAKSPELALTFSQEAEYALNDARNKVAALGGTHMKIITQNQGVILGATINAEAYNCP